MGERERDIYIQLIKKSCQAYVFGYDPSESSEVEWGGVEREREGERDRARERE